MLNQKLLEILKEKNKTISFVESCTAGGASKYLAQVPTASSVLKGSLVTYQNEVKVQLGVDKNTIEEQTAVCFEVAKQMAKNGRAFFKSDYSLAITGWAGPSGGSGADPVGTVYFAVCGEGLECVERRTFSESNDRISLMNKAVEVAFEILLKSLAGEKN